MPKKKAAGKKQDDGKTEGGAQRQATQSFERAATTDEWVVETPAMADKHASLLSRCEHLTHSILNVSQREVVRVFLYVCMCVCVFV